MYVVAVSMLHSPKKKKEKKKKKQKKEKSCETEKQICNLLCMFVCRCVWVRECVYTYI